MLPYSIIVLKDLPNIKKHYHQSMLLVIKSALGRGQELPYLLPMVHVGNNEPLKT